MQPIKSPEDIIAFFKDYNLSLSTQKYLEFHALRYFILWHKIKSIIEIKVKNQPKNYKLQILDIGPGLFTELLGQYYPDLEIHTLGLNSGYFDLKTKPIFHKYDLNQLYYSSESASNLVKDLPKFDLILFCEVLEHLYTGPEQSFDFLEKILKPKSTLVIQTPNATSLHHRLIMLLGRNPFPLLRPNPMEPGHFREYTERELKMMLKQAALKLEQLNFHNYFNYSGNLKNRIYKFLTRFFPSHFRDGITIEAIKD